MILQHALGFLGLLTTILGFFITVFCFVWYRRGLIRIREREERLPDATRFEDLRRQVVDYEGRFDAIKEDLLNAREEIGKGQAARGEYEQLTNYCQSLRIEKGDLERDFAKRKHEAEIEHGKIINDLQSELNVATQKRDAGIEEVQQQLKQQAARLADELDKCQREFEKKKLRVMDSLNEEIRSAQAALTDLQNKLARRKQSIEDECADHKSQLERSLLDLEQAHSRQKELVAMERQTQLNETQHEFDQRLFELTKQFQTQEAILDRQGIQLENRIRGLRETHADLESKHKSLIAQFDQSKKEYSELATRLQTLRSEKDHLENTVERLQQLWDRLLQQTGGGDDSERTAELWQPVLFENKIAAPISEKECLANVEDYLKSCGLYFSQRIVHAFHTSLKVAHASPLAVLAGISGTGKSELPRRYAEAVGINFLPLAVQPRWDSPQDLFGFFNYLENRFRATELGRALVQMDPFAGETGRGWPTPTPEEHVNLSGQMLLVLLDEMNLARVEYYFSDFLSKLETRRGVDRNNPEQRRKAELALEIGRTGLGSPVMNIFVDTNVLFVGTMNEDETTQTLSDKVIDRSNLIRFGSPKQLNIEGNVSPALKASGRLSSSTWRDWKEPVKDMTNDRERTDEYIERLNEAMSVIRRPFAHRTSQAIRAYVDCYPQISDNSFNHAMADQIEQKLLPKFRGLDPSESDVRESLDKIRDIVEELEDVEFLDALQSSRVGHQISWSGVDRSIAGQTV